MTEIKMYDGIDSCMVCSNQPRILRRIHKLKTLFPYECVQIGKENDNTERWTLPYWWWNCRKRNRPTITDGTANLEDENVDNAHSARRELHV